MNHPRLRRIIRRLQLRNIHNMPTHTRRRHETPIRIPLQRASIQRRPLRLLSPEVLPRRPRAVKRPVEIRRHHLRVVSQVAVDHGALRPGDPAVGDEDVEAAVELGDDVVDGRDDGVGGGDVDLVGFAWVVLVDFRG